MSNQSYILSETDEGFKWKFDNKRIATVCSPTFQDSSLAMAWFKSELNKYKIFMGLTLSLDSEFSYKSNSIPVIIPQEYFKNKRN